MEPLIKWEGHLLEALGPFFKARAKRQYPSVLPERATRKNGPIASSSPARQPPLFPSAASALRVALKRGRGLRWILSYSPQWGCAFESALPAASFECNKCPSHLISGSQTLLFPMHENTERILTRDCAAIQIPAGNTILLPAGSTVFITQSLGGSYTVATEMGLARLSAQNADALGLEVPTGAATPEVAHAADAPVDEKRVWDQLKTCYDPEIPVNIVDLGLIYDCQITPRNGDGALVTVKMTLTAPGCGMGPVLAQEAKAKIESLPGVGEAEVDLVWDPPWNQAMISEAGKMQLGII